MHIVFSKLCTKKVCFARYFSLEVQINKNNKHSLSGLEHSLKARSSYQSICKQRATTVRGKQNTQRTLSFQVGYTTSCSMPVHTQATKTQTQPTGPCLGGCLSLMLHILKPHKICSMNEKVVPIRYHTENSSHCPDLRTRFISVNC